MELTTIFSPSSPDLIFNMVSPVNVRSFQGSSLSCIYRTRLVHCFCSWRAHCSYPLYVPSSYHSAPIRRNPGLYARSRRPLEEISFTGVSYWSGCSQQFEPASPRPGLYVLSPRQSSGTRCQFSEPALEGAEMGVYRLTNSRSVLSFLMYSVLVSSHKHGQ